MRAPTLTQRTIQLGLAFRDFRDVHLLPAKEAYWFTGSTTYPPSLHPISEKRFRDEIRAVADSSKQMVFGISTTTSDYYKFRQIARFLRDNYPGAIIVGGGPHFKRESLIDALGRRYRDPVEIALEEGLADAINVGHAFPFIQFICDPPGKRGDATLRGFYHRDTAGKIVGRGRGKYPPTGTVPYIYQRERDEFDILTSDRCSNACSFCSINRVSLGFSQQTIAAALREMAETPVRGINFADSNPFAPGKNNLLDVLDALEPADSILVAQKHKIGFIDPSLLCNESGLALIKKLIQHRFAAFFAGRDAVTHQSAEFIGSKFKKRVKSQEQLDEERKALIRFISLLQQTDTDTSFLLAISYIISPFETETSITKVQEEVEAFSALSSKKVEIQIYIMNLMPDPGTEVKKKHFGLLVDPENFDEIDVHTNPWTYALGPSSWLLDYLGRGSRIEPKKRLKRAIQHAFRPTLWQRFETWLNGATDQNRDYRRFF